MGDKVNIYKKLMIPSFEMVNVWCLNFLGVGWRPLILDY